MVVEKICVYLSLSDSGTFSTRKKGPARDVQAWDHVHIAHDNRPDFKAGQVTVKFIYDVDRNYMKIPRWSTPTLHLHHPDPATVRYPIPFPEAGNALMTPLRLRVSMGDDDHLLSNDSPIYLRFEYAIKNSNARFAVIRISDHQWRANCSS
ncbi:hypothetical protein EVAR_39101_1 [Eumeta japonica]|uniref:Uncharacterized protein n=1 Tax=Eumeta variegata TaxID=151549 RepID=A0A4C1X694_EUMVA|nr:hypothetical protein EVAR_39101_1 [Eumeta japonica]